ncbi:helix-turn-helix domain-containing protein [Streptomyces hygroscopicus]|uniref:helix-turn-helix domain-containing protein n=1 Tax=Streptomyces hygroscopicus TaxID=1912 RepID=UPI0033E91B25
MSGGKPGPARTEAKTIHARIVGRNVRVLRHDRGLRLADLAQKVTEGGYPMILKTVQQIETGTSSGAHRAVTVDELVALAKALEVSPAELLKPTLCPVCHGEPVPGFTCNTCGASR